ncbi:hypothetical protein THAOC_20571, partial [Thalassiosira oceanica]
GTFPATRENTKRCEGAIKVIQAQGVPQAEEDVEERTKKVKKGDQTVLAPVVYIHVASGQFLGALAQNDTFNPLVVVGDLNAYVTDGNHSMYMVDEVREFQLPAALVGDCAPQGGTLFGVPGGGQSGMGSWTAASGTGACGGAQDDPKLTLHLLPQGRGQSAMVPQAVGVRGDDGVYPARPSALCTPTGPLDWVGVPGLLRPQTTIDAPTIPTIIDLSAPILGTVQGGKRRRRRIRWILFHCIDMIFQAPDSDDDEWKKDPISLRPQVKKLLKGDGALETTKVILGWLVDILAGTIELPPCRVACLHEMSDAFPRTRKTCSKRNLPAQAGGVVGELRSMVVGLAAWVASCGCSIGSAVDFGRPCVPEPAVQGCH